MDAAAPPRLSARTLIPLSLWRAVVAAVALYGFWLGYARDPANLAYLTQLATLLALVSGAFLGVMGGSLDSTANLLLHFVTPLLVLLSLPLAYVIFYVLYGQVLDAFLDPRDGGFAPTVAAFTGVVAMGGYAIWGLGRLKTLRLGAA